MGGLVLRVLACIATEHDYRLVFLAVLICAATSVTTFHTYALATRKQGARRMAWVLLTAVGAICGLHFTAMAAVTAVPDPGIVVHSSAMNGSTLTVAVAGIAVLVILALLAMSYKAREGRREGVRPPSGGSVRANEVYAIRDLTDRRRIEEELRHQNKVLQEREEELRKQNRRFEVTLANMPHGLCMIDPEHRIVVCNNRYVEMYDLPAHLTKPGTPITDVFEHRIGKALYSPEEDEEYKSKGFRAMLEPTVKIRRLSDGRVILISRQPTGDGGWIAIHEDITEQQRLSARLEEQNLLLQQREAELQTQNASLDMARAKLEAQNANLDMALANMSQGLAMFDAEERLVLANDRYAEIYGLEAQHLRPGATLRELVEYRISKGLYQGVAADEVLQNMRERVARKRVNHLVSRPGDGRVLSVSIQPRTHGGWVVTLHDVTERERLNARLIAQNTLLQQREEELAAQNTRFDAAIGNMSQGMCLYDAHQRIVFANNRYAEIYGLTPEQVQPGTTLRQIFEARVANGAHGGGDSEKFILEGVARCRKCTSEVLELSDGRFISVVRRPMPDGGLLSTHEDITERERLNARLMEQNALLQQREEELGAQNTRFDAAIGNMSQGMCLYDAEQRIVFANNRFTEIYGLTPEQVQPGTTLRQIFEARVANGAYSGGDEEKFVRDGLERFRGCTSEVIELSDGRFISVVRRPIPGGGLLTTQEDITERERLNARLEQQNMQLKAQEERLRNQNVQLDAALSNMLQGLAMYDSQQRLVMCNNRYAEMYGLSLEQVRPGTPLREIIEHRIANGEYRGKTADELIGGMRERVAGHRVAQYASQLDDGRHIAVSVQPMPDGGTVTTHHDITEQRLSEAKISYMALHDTLTGLPNRVLLNERLEDALRRVKRGEIVATLLLDLDHFKTVNDTLGHPAGDKLLQAVADRLRSVVRETDTIARMGGDEFAIVQTAIAQPADATALAHRAIECVSAPYVIEGHQVVIGTSVGIAVGPSDGTSPEQLIRNADLALYRAKGDGRGTYSFFEREMDAQMQVRRAMEYDLRKALVAGQFELHYQPVLNLASNDVSGFEALIRWRHPEKGLVAPGAFIPLAEEMGFIVQLGEWAIREACATAAQWPGELKIAVNLSPAQFRSPGLVQVVVGALAATGLAPERLELEITEGTLLQDSEATLSMLYQLRALGVRIAMDDFGTGYSSLSYLQSFPFDKIKIDRSFIKDIADGVGSLNIVRAVAALANGLGMTTTAEGVETKEQLDTVRAEGCTEMQGFLFSKPLPASEVEPFLRQCAGDKAPQQGEARGQRNAADAA